MVRPGPGTFQPGVAGAAAGLDADLIELFAARTQRTVRFVTARTPLELVNAVAGAKAVVGIGGLVRPLAPDAAVDSDLATDTVLWSRGYQKVEPVLIYNVEAAVPRSWKDLAGTRIAFVPNPGFTPALDALRARLPEVRWQSAAFPTADGLIANVSAGHTPYAIVSSHEAAMARNLHLAFDVAFAVDRPRELAWIVAPGAQKLRAEIDGFLASLARDGTLARLSERNFAHQRRVPRPDAEVLHERIESLLPPLRAAFQQAQRMTGLEWRFLAAIAYQESQWDPSATSETGVRGIMQLTQETARHLGDIDRLDPRASILAAAHYLRDLKAKLPARIQEPDRTWFALAAFNIGLGHLEDARILAQRQKLNPDLWSDVKKMLPLLAVPEFYEQARLGYARGGMPVAFVDRVRAYHDVLLARQAAFSPLLHDPFGELPQRAPKPSTPAPTGRRASVADEAPTRLASR